MSGLESDLLVGSGIRERTSDRGQGHSKLQSNCQGEERPRGRYELSTSPFVFGYRQSLLHGNRSIDAIHSLLPGLPNSITSLPN